MSSILKALKRLEQEKAVRRPHELNVDAEIIRGVQLQRRTPVVVIFAAALALFAGGGGVAYLVLKPAAPHPAGTISPFVQQVTPVTVPTAPVESIIPRADEIKLMDSREETSATQPNISNARRQDPTPPMPPVPASPARNLPAQTTTTVPEQAPPTHSPPASMPPSQPLTPKKEIKLDGIAFQDGGGESLAVINGKTVTRGATVDGVRVEDIQRDRVKLSRGGEQFEIILDRSN